MWVRGNVEIIRKLEKDLDDGWKDCVGEGWHPLLYTFARNVDYLVTIGEMPEVHFTQLKQKFGTLRLYYAGGNDETSRMSAIAEDLSAHMCEVCGRKPSQQSNSGWIRTLCEEHRQEK